MFGDKLDVRASATCEAARNIGALIIRIVFGVYYTTIITRNPQNPILVIKALT